MHTAPIHDPREIAAHTAHDAQLLSLLVADKRVDWYRAEVRISGERVPVPVALHWAAIKQAQGDREAVECVTRDCLQALEKVLLPWAEDEAERRTAEDERAVRTEEQMLADEDRALRAERMNDGSALYGFGVDLGRAT